MRRAADYWMILDATVRFFLLRILFPILSLQSLITFVHLIPGARYRGLSAGRREIVFAWLVRLSKKYARRSPMVQALTLYWMDSRANLAIGVSRTEENLSGHAWVESEQQILSTLETSTYSRLVRYGARGELIF